MQTQNLSYIRRMRYSVQWAIFALILYAGWEFYRFVEHITTDGPMLKRPSLVDGFLPIGGIMSLKHYLATFELNPVHPAALIIFASALISSLLFKKSFCGFVCPVGTLSEAAFLLGARIFGRNFRIHRYIDYPLRALKYILLGFFVYIVAFKMSIPDIEGFMSTPYWKVADVKMLHFFTRMTALTAWVLAALTVLSLLYKNFWCRYLCPYGALTGLLSILSPLKITRDDNKCILCSKCTKHCPNLLNVENSGRIWSPECSGCLTCVSHCPAPGALDMKFPCKRHRVWPAAFIGLALAGFFALIAIAMLTGHWNASVSYEEYKALIPLAESFGHP